MTAEVLSIGTELTVGDTRDTNAGDLARWLSERGVTVGRAVALRDELDAVRSAFDDALGRADLVVSTGGLGPTPDDLTREAIASVCGETPSVDPGLEAWLRELWTRRNLPFVDANLKQAWLIPSAVAIPNPNGTAPGWWVDRPDGRVVVALPGPPREMRPMWTGWVLPRLVERDLGRAIAVRTLRTTGIGESLVVDRLGEDLMSATNPVITTYARAEAVDVRIAAEPADGRTAMEIADRAEEAITDRLGEHVWARGETTWADALDTMLSERAWSLATVETGTGGALAGLLGASSRLRRATVIATGVDLPRVEGRELSRGDANRQHGDVEDADVEDADAAPSTALASAARWARTTAGADIGLALRARVRGDDTAVSVSIETPSFSHSERRVVFLGGPQGRLRAAVAAASILHAVLLGASPQVETDRVTIEQPVETEVQR